MCIEFHETSRDKPTAKTPSPAYRLTRMQCAGQFLRAPAFFSPFCVSARTQSARRRASFGERAEPPGRAIPRHVSSFFGPARTASRGRNPPERKGTRKRAPGASHLAAPVPLSRERRRTGAWRRPLTACRSRGWKAAGDPPTSISTDSTKRRVERRARPSTRARVGSGSDAKKRCPPTS